MPIISNAEAIAHWATLPPAFINSFGDEGDVARQYLLHPTIFALLGDIQGKTILDAGCGQGYLARLLSKRRAQVTGLEPATPLIEYAIPQRWGYRFHRSLSHYLMALIRRAGTLVVWDVDLLSEDVVRIYRADDPDKPVVYHRNELTEAEPTVSGWTMPVNDLFT